MYRLWEEFWWSKITGPHLLIEEVSNALYENKIVFLQVPADLPWRHAMRNEVRSSLSSKTQGSDLLIEQIDAADDNPENMEPGKFILDGFADDETIRHGYREKSKTTIQEYLLSRGILRGRVLWVKGLSGEAAKQWEKFCRAFPGGGLNGGAMILEYSGDIPEGKNIAVIRYGDYVTSHDVQLFSDMIMSEQADCSDLWKLYKATIAATLCDTDAEIAKLLLENTDFRGETVFDGLEKIAQDEVFLRRGTEEKSNHVLWYYRSGNRTELERRVWAAQVKVLFPLIEMERIQLIKSNEKAIAEALQNRSMIQYGERITNTIDVELGTLCYMMRQREEEGQYLLYIPDEAQRRRIVFLHECRNCLAHVECCTRQQVNILLG